MTKVYARFYQFAWLIYEPGSGSNVTSGVLGALTVVLGALRPVLATARLASAVTMSPPAPPAFRRGCVDRVGHALKLRQTTMLILRSITRWPGRAAVTFFGVSASVAVMIASLFAFDSVGVLTNKLFVLSNRQNVTLILADARHEGAATEAHGLPGVRQVEGGFGLSVRVVNGARSELSTLEAVREHTRADALAGRQRPGCVRATIRRRVARTDGGDAEPERG
ncbi:MAG: hypothetical protein H7317_08020 [Pseudorhodobacter sp.]|nr:hypothetical protein [Pseudorhodobacter sp.]